MNTLNLLPKLVDMPKFYDIKEAFQYFIDNVYPSLTSEEKEHLRKKKYDFYNRNLSENTMLSILGNYAKVTVNFGSKTIIFDD